MDAETNRVGDIEGITGNNFFVGESAAGGDDQFCTSKQINNLSSVRGLCPEAPTVNGSFAAAGIAYYAHTNDLRTGAGFEGDQTIQTLGITLATNSAVINVPLGDVGAAESIRIVPAYRLLTGGGDGGGALVDFKIVKPHTETAVNSGVYEASFYLNWEDSEQGGDFDNDVWGIISYSLDTNESPAEITITTDIISQTTGGADQLFGFVTSGTTQDGFHAYSGILEADFPGTAAAGGAAAVPGCNDCEVGDGAVSHTFVISQNAIAANEIESPLYYAAKYGSFNDAQEVGEVGFGVPHADGDVADASEFDVENNATGALVPDGIPDGFFAATNPANLVDAVGRALDRALQTCLLYTSPSPRDRG